MIYAFSNLWTVTILGVGLVLIPTALACCAAASVGKLPRGPFRLFGIVGNGAAIGAVVVGAICSMDSVASMVSAARLVDGPTGDALWRAGMVPALLPVACGVGVALLYEVAMRTARAIDQHHGEGHWVAEERRSRLPPR